MLQELSNRLTEEFDKGFSVRTLQQMKKFYAMIRASKDITLSSSLKTEYIAVKHKTSARFSGIIKVLISVAGRKRTCHSLLTTRANSPTFAMDRELLFRFQWSTRLEMMDALWKIYKDTREDTLVGFIIAEATKTRGSLLYILRHSVELSNEECKNSLIFEYVTGKKEVRSDDESAK